MSTNVLTIGPDEPSKAAARIMIAKGVSGLPVVDSDNNVIGIVTEADFVVQIAARSVVQQHRFFGTGKSRKRIDIVRDMMTATPVVITSDARIADAAQVMNDRRVKRLPVVSSDGALIGIISRADIVGAYARPDEVIEDAVRQDVIKRILMIDPDELDVSVVEGVVSVAGRVDTRSDAQLLEELTLRIEGVVVADINVEWRHGESIV